MFLFSSTQRTSSDRKLQKPLQSSAVAARGPVPLRPGEQSGPYYAHSAVRSTTPVATPPDFEPRTRFAPSSRSATTPQRPVAGQTIPIIQLPAGMATNNAQPTSEGRPGIAQMPPAPAMETNVATSARVPSASHVTQVPITVPGGPILPNILIFGETGTGKSSLINMLAGHHIAGVSSDALGYTFGSQAHNVSIDGNLVRLWDTAGLNEGEHGTVPAEQAMRNLQDLVHNLKGGVSLLIYCIRGTRFRDIMQINYDLFCSIICQNNVPAVIVVTGLENESPMESWWEENGGQLKAHGMNFTGHACVTTTRGKQLKSGEYMFEEEFEESEDKTRKLVTDHYLRSPWIIDERTWLTDITSKLAGYYEQQTYELAENGQNSVLTNRNNGARVFIWKVGELMMKAIHDFTYSLPQQYIRALAGTRPNPGRM